MKEQFLDYLDDNRMQYDKLFETLVIVRIDGYYKSEAYKVEKQALKLNWEVRCIDYDKEAKQNKLIIRKKKLIVA